MPLFDQAMCLPRTCERQLGANRRAEHTLLSEACDLAESISIWANENSMKCEVLVDCKFEGPG